MGGWLNALLQQELSNGFVPPTINASGIKIVGKTAGQLGNELDVGSFGNAGQFENLGGQLAYFHGATAFGGVPLVVIEADNGALHPQMQLLDQSNATAGFCNARIFAANTGGTFQIRMTTDNAAHSASFNLNDGQVANVFSIGDGASVNLLTMLLAGGLTLKSPVGVTPAGAAGVLGIGTQSGFGTGAAGQAVTTTALGGGTGPAAPTTVVNYLKISLGGAFFWIPLFQ